MLNKTNIKGYTTPIHRSLTAPLLWLGVPRNILLLEMLIGILGGIILKAIFVPVTMFFVHFLLRFLTNIDPLIFDIFFLNTSHKLFYHK